MLTALQNVVDFMDDLDLLGPDPVKLYFGHYLGSYWNKCHKILTRGSMGRRLQTNLNILSILNVRCT